MNKNMNKRWNEKMNKWTNEQMNKWTNEQLIKWTNEQNPITFHYWGNAVLYEVRFTVSAVIKNNTYMMTLL